MPEYLPRASSVYDPAQLDKMFALLLVRLSEISASLTQVASENNRAIGQLADNRLYELVDTDRKSVVLAYKSRGRLHKIQMQSEGISNPSGGVAPADAQFIVSAADTDLPNADVLTAVANQTTVSNGVVGTVQDIGTGSIPQFSRLGLGQAAHASKSINATHGAIFADNVDIDADSKALTLGADQDATLQYNGTDLLINPKAVGSGRAEVQGDLKVTGQPGFNGQNPPAASTGWAVSNVTPDKVFDANATSLDEIADVLGTLITFLLLRGDLSA